MLTRWQYDCALRNLGVPSELVFCGDGWGSPDRESEWAWLARGLRLNHWCYARVIEGRFKAAWRRIPSALLYPRIAPQHRATFETNGRATWEV